MKKHSPALIAVFALLFLTAPYACKATTPNPNLPDGQTLRANGRDLVFYPGLKLAPASKEPKKSGEVQTLSASDSSNANGTSFGSFQGYEVVLKNSAPSSLSSSSVKTTSSSSQTGFLSGEISTVPTGFVLYNKTESKFELTNGVIQADLAKGARNLDLSTLFDVEVISSYRSYRTLKPLNPEEFPRILNELENSDLIDSVKLIMTPPKATPK